MAENKPTNEQNDWLVSSKQMFNQSGSDYNRIWQKVHIGLTSQGIALDYNTARREVLIDRDADNKVMCMLTLEIFDVLRYHDFAPTGMGLVLAKFAGIDNKDSPICTCQLMTDEFSSFLRKCHSPTLSHNEFVELVDLCTKF